MTAEKSKIVAPVADKSKAVSAPVAKKIATKKPAADKASAKVSAKHADKKVAAVKKVKKAAKPKVVRDSFTMPEAEYQKIADIKVICAKAGVPVKKSEVLRAGLLMLSLLDAAEMKTVFGKLEKIATGRPKKGQAN
ncbi:MAG: hypothetical protein PXX73_07150 [Sideroxydans sp.]|nr:hypothetical protein [Sideroxydans sp.]